MEPLFAWLPESHIGDTKLEPSNFSLEMWNKEKMKALGTCKLPLENPKISHKYMVKFVVVEEELTSPHPAESQGSWEDQTYQS